MTLQEILDEGIGVDFYKFNDKYCLKLYKFDTEIKLKIQTQRMFNSCEWLYINEILDMAYEEFKYFEKQQEKKNESNERNNILQRL